MALGYLEPRALVFICGLVVLLFLLVHREAKGHVLLVTVLAYWAAVMFVLYRPEVGREELQDFKMSWCVGAKSSAAREGAQVTLTFVDYPEHHLIEYSDELAEHLSRNAKDWVSVKFKVTTDHGNVRGFQMIEIDGMTDWRSNGGYLHIAGGTSRSPWD
ncbi:hypothetical protein [Roseimicrobium sp. ORNL1]|uniref:hypothetical protein n=1 Tax=Roseimicrobium sp. ORNL1 TaxID=2711231 RepID=UPI0013E19D01|nr:hypothetical protein [Roseimicrobium sp. ORNL1]QIF05536.1 hypothetical protein G5S37_29905 [Roseimicrobium sp. ORNL1]